MTRLLGEIEEIELPRRFKSEPVSPPVDIGEAHGEVYVRVQVPGASKEGLTLQLLDGRLIIEGETKENCNEDKPEYSHREGIRWGHFFREIPLPGNLDVEKARAYLDQGTLRVHIPKLMKSEKSAVTVPIE
jgi:HSP20 family protein